MAQKGKSGNLLSSNVSKTIILLIIKQILPSEMISQQIADFWGGGCGGGRKKMHLYHDNRTQHLSKLQTKFGTYSVVA